jgi:hypothetical protein
MGIRTILVNVTIGDHRHFPLRLETINGLSGAGIQLKSVILMEMDL